MTVVMLKAGRKPDHFEGCQPARQILVIDYMPVGELISLYGCMKQVTLLKHHSDEQGAGMEGPKPMFVAQSVGSAEAHEREDCLLTSRNGR